MTVRNKRICCAVLYCDSLQKLKLNNIRAINDYTEDGDDDDEYGFVNAGAAQSISPRQVDTGKKLADGKFAVVKRGSLTVGNETHPVAVKMLKRTQTATHRTCNELTFLLLHR